MALLSKGRLRDQPGSEHGGGDELEMVVRHNASPDDL